MVERTGYDGMALILLAAFRSAFLMRNACPPTWALLLLLSAGAVAAADDPPTEKPAEAPPSAPAPTDSAPPPAPMSQWKWEGAIGPIGSVAPQYSGASSRKYSVVPGFYLRYGRISVSNASGFVTRRNKDDIFRGLGLDVKQDDRLRLNVALRLDNGRKSSDSNALAGIEDVRRTIRARSSATYSFDGGWKAAVGWSADLLGRGGGNFFDAGVSHDRRLSPFSTWTVAAGTSWADRRYMQSYYGVTPAEAIASGYSVFMPGAGVRDVNLGMGWRTEINPRWLALWGGSVGKLLGPAAKSPLTMATKQWGLNAGIAWRF